MFMRRKQYKYVPDILFSNEQRERMLEAAGGLPNSEKTEDLFIYLQVMASDYLFKKLCGNQIMPYELEKIFKRLNSSARKIKKELYRYDNDLLPPDISIYLVIGFYSQGADPRKKKEMLEYLNLFEEVTAIALENIKGKKRISKAVRQSDEHIDKLYGHLCEAWMCFFKKRPGTSVGGPLSDSAGKAGGPFVRFIGEYFNSILNCLSRDFRESQPDIVKQLSISEEAIRHRIRKADFLESSHT